MSCLWLGNNSTCYPQNTVKHVERLRVDDAGRPLPTFLSSDSRIFHCVLGVYQHLLVRITILSRVNSRRVQARVPLGARAFCLLAGGREIFSFTKPLALST